MRAVLLISALPRPALSSAPSDTEEKETFASQDPLKVAMPVSTSTRRSEPAIIADLPAYHARAQLHSVLLAPTTLF